MCGEATVLNGRGMTTPAEVGFSVQELQCALSVIEDLVKYVKYVSTSGEPVIKSLNWKRAHFKEDIDQLKKVIQETVEVLHPEGMVCLLRPRAGAKTKVGVARSMAGSGVGSSKVTGKVTNQVHEL